MSATKFIALLEEQGLLDPEVIQELHRSVAEAKSRITAESLAKLLVDNGQLTRFQATRLVGQLKGVADMSSTSSSAAATASQSSDDDGLELLDEVAEPAQNVLEAKRLDSPQTPVEVEVIEDFEDALPAHVEEEVVAGDSNEASSSFGEPAAAYVKPVKLAGPKGNQWDAFRIWGVGFFLSVLLVALTWLVFWLISGSAGEYYGRAREAYESRDYEVAAERFSTFAAGFPNDERVSLAKVFATIAKIREASDQLGDPAKAIEIGESMLPTIINEAGLSDDGVRADLASALVSIAEKMLQRTDGAKTTEDRKNMVDVLDRHLVVMRNPQYIPNANRITNESRIKAIDEERSRILRDIQREEDLVVAIGKMQAAVEQKDVDAAYQARRAVTRKYPQLETEAKLLELQKQATELQREAVNAASKNPELVDPSATVPVGQSVLLYKITKANNKKGESTAIDPELILFVRAKGSIYGIRGADGSVLWRRHVGIANASDPIRVSNDPNSDCILVMPKANRLARLSGRDGTSQWELDMGSRILQPTIDGQSIFVATEDGRVASIDADTGQVKWNKQIPQKIATGIGFSPNKPGRYVVGDHSNLYVLGRNDGTCNEVFFLGHSAGTIVVPPVHSLGQLFVCVNFDAGTSRIHIFKTNEEGVKIEKNQDPITLKGHINIPPSLDGRRLVVMTDLGETVAFDIEPASNKNKLNRVAGLGSNEAKPRIAWPLVVGNELWIASNRFARFRIQVVDGKLVPDWVIHDEDQFAGRPAKFEDVVFHSRIVRGTEGVRLAASNALTADNIWEVDLGVPISGIHAASNGIVAINSQAAFFLVEPSAFGAGKSLNAKENPGRNQSTLRFSGPTLLDNNRVAYLNPKQGIQVALFDPKATGGNNLLVNTLQLSDGRPSNHGMPLKSGIVVPIDNGQLAYVDPTSGKQLVPPFQPTLEVNQPTSWMTPVLLSDGQTLVSATNHKNLYRLGISKQFKELSQTGTENRWVGRLAASADVVCGVARGNAQDSIEFYLGTDLSRIAGVEIDGRVTWGPYTVNKTFLIYSETSGLLAFDDAGKQLWKCDIGQVGLVSEPLVEKEDYLVSSTDGYLFRVQQASGELVAKVQIGEPIAASPIILGSGLLVPGAEGVLLAIPLSKTATSNTEGNN